jgi:hypothetical protein
VARDVDLAHDLGRSPRVAACELPVTQRRRSTFACARIETCLGSTVPATQSLIVSPPPLRPINGSLMLNVLTPSLFRLFPFHPTAHFSCWFRASGAVETSQHESKHNGQFKIRTKVLTKLNYSGVGSAGPSTLPECPCRRPTRQGSQGAREIWQVSTSPTRLPIHRPLRCQLFVLPLYRQWE